MARAVRFDEYGDVDSNLYMLSGEGADYAQLKRIAESTRQRLVHQDRSTVVKPVVVSREPASGHHPNVKCGEEHWTNRKPHRAVECGLDRCDRCAMPLTREENSKRMRVTES